MFKFKILFIDICYYIDIKLLYILVYYYTMIIFIIIVFSILYNT
jgi:hypothetical protein